MAQKSESTQKQIDRVRTPRVHITYDVETGGANVTKEIPFVVGILADLSGQPKEPLLPLEKRKFEEIDRDNLDEVMARQKPRLVLKVENHLTNGVDKLGVELEFTQLADFHPENVARHYKPLQKLLELREKLHSLKNTLHGNDDLERAIRQSFNEVEEIRAREAKRRATDNG